MLTLNDLRQLDDRGVHNFSIGVIDAYFELSRLFWRGSVNLYNGRVLQIGGRVSKSFVYGYDPADADLLRRLRKSGTMYSLDLLPCFETPGKFSEIAYQLPQVFDPASYPNSKKRHQRLTYPFKWLDKSGVTFSSPLRLTPNQMVEVETFHDEWVKRKLDDPDTFRQMFPQERYKRCVHMHTQPGYQVILAYKDGQLVGCRVFFLREEGHRAFDLAFFTAFWLPGMSQFSEYFNMWCLQWLHLRGWRTMNCGSSFSGPLKAFKTHLPHDEVISYSYSKKS